MKLDLNKNIDTIETSTSKSNIEVSNLLNDLW